MNLDAGKMNQEKLRDVAQELAEILWRLRASAGDTDLNEFFNRTGSVNMVLDEAGDVLRNPAITEGTISENKQKDLVRAGELRDKLKAMSDFHRSN